MPGSQGKWLRALLGAGLLALCAVVLWFTLEPTPGGHRAHELPRFFSEWLNDNDFLANYLAFFALAVASFTIGFRKPGVRMVLLLLLLLPNGIEFAQKWIPGRVSDWRDVAAAWGGIGTAWLIFLAGRHTLRRLRRTAPAKH